MMTCQIKYKRHQLLAYHPERNIRRKWPPCEYRSIDKLTDSHDKWRRDLSAESLSDSSGGRSGRGFGCGGSASWHVWPCHWTVCQDELCGRSSRQGQSGRQWWTVPRNASVTLLWNSHINTFKIRFFSTVLILTSVLQKFFNVVEVFLGCKKVRSLKDSFKSDQWC